jgi:predicted RNA-binding Zn ribbon-like protein
LGHARERLTNSEAVRQWARTAGILDEDEPFWLDEAGLEGVRGAREAIYAVMQPLATGASPDEALLARLNARLTAIASHRVLASEDGAIGWRWSFGPGAGERLTAPLLAAAADLLASGAWRRIRQCNDKHCGWLFLDQSKAGRRRWCSMADCGNRAKAARHHRRLKAG